ncbi:Asp-tRNA(Asn)/Glu-tRNA(Gln) amidotransferase subunit GatB [Metallumcola ferriviriculae]|uniref:Asp-tRNA(Asn)/Glu-tRNA(Gln) amidotransferase subunit GatB n=1 Tax=Metallumcola ferriviriculae TaxID=3039180 RepID=UPI003457D75B
MIIEYEAVIGLEVHAELKTNSKIFCACSTEFGGDPNTHVCPVCLGLPGVLPVLNKEVVDYALKAGLALNCQIAEYSKFDRKNYFYPDLPKAYQVSQYDLPICEHGYLDIEVDGKTKRIGITRLHMEEDAGKLVHQGTAIVESNSSLVDYNRTGVPLVEIVSEPDMRSAEEAKAYLEKVKAILQYTEVSDCKMQEGSLRCDANISVRPKGTEKLGTKAELKNMNSFKALQKAIEYEIARQIELIEDGEKVVQETRSWDENKGISVSLRSKEEAHDYRYFPEPDLVPLVIDKQWVERIRATLPELPDDRKQRLVNELGLPEYDAAVITGSKDLADYLDRCLEYYPDAKKVSNWIMGELLRLLNNSNMEPAEAPVEPKEMAELLKLMDKGTISGTIAKQVFEEMFNTGKSAAEIVAAKGLEQISDQSELEKIVEKVITDNPQSVADYRGGKKQAAGFMVGQVMKATRGKANPKLVNELLQKKL